MRLPSILALAPNGAYKQKTDHPALPLKLDEIVLTAQAAQAAGVTLLHLHIRDHNNQHSLDPVLYRRTIDAIEDQLGESLIIQITSEAAGKFSPAQQIESIQSVKPACVSIALRELITDQTQTVQARALFHWCAEHACRAQFILYSEDDLRAYLRYRQADLIPDSPHSVLFVLGRYRNSGQSSIEDLTPYLSHASELDTPWMVCAFGASEQAVVLEAALQGGHIRIGFENNLLRCDASISTNNTQQVSDLQETAAKRGILIANIKETREILAIH